MTAPTERKPRKPHQPRGTIDPSSATATSSARTVTTSPAM